MRDTQHDLSKSGGTVGRTLAVLDMVADAGRPLRFSDILPLARLPKATLYRFLQVLTHQGMLTFDEERQTYAPGLRLVRLAHAAWAQSSLAPIAAPHLDRLSAETGLTVHLAQLDEGMVLYVDKRNAARPVEMFSQAGKIGPAYCTGVGKAMLAFLPAEAQDQAIARQSFHRFTPATLTTPQALRADLARIRDQGHAWDDQEHEPGIHCLAVPILSPAGRVTGALSITLAGTPAAGRGREALAPHLPLLHRAADSIAAAAAAWRFPEHTEPEEAPHVRRPA